MFRVLVVGDKFIPASTYVEQWQAKKSQDPLFDDIELIPIDWNLDKAEQHRLQQVMEWDGANAVEAPPEILAAVADVDALVMHFAPVGKDIIEAAPHLKLIAVARAGLENVDQVAADARGIVVTGVVGRNAAAVAELAIGLMLSECRNIARADQSIKSGGWRKTFEPPMIELGESTIGIVGWGQVARHLGKKLSGLAHRIIVHDPYTSPEDIIAAGAEVVDFDEVFQRSDFVHVMARLTPETERFIGAQQFAMMKPTAYFINTARSRLVDYDALYEALATKTIAGAGLDVFDDEPLATDSPWRTLDNVTMTTHYGGDTTGTNNTSARLVLEAIAAFLQRS
jgi:D-3-phosphoglycerate dehydrogenase / 2-oxoglutarate reductase